MFENKSLKPIFRDGMCTTTWNKNSAAIITLKQFAYEWRIKYLSFVWCIFEMLKNQNVQIKYQSI